jgi:beta-glucosidase
VPALAGGQPGTYLEPPLGRNTEGISNLDPTPLFPFGHGLSYTTFAYTDLRLSADRIGTDEAVTVTATVTNTGDRPGEEVVQLYYTDVHASQARPVRQLAGFARVPLGPGDSARVAFILHAERTAFTNQDMDRVVEPGRIDLAVGPSAEDRPLVGSITITGRTRRVGRDWVLTTPASITAPAMV